VARPFYVRAQSLRRSSGRALMALPRVSIVSVGRSSESEYSYRPRGDFFDQSKSRTQSRIRKHQCGWSSGVASLPLWMPKELRSFSKSRSSCFSSFPTRPEPANKPGGGSTDVCLSLLVRQVTAVSSYRVMVSFSRTVLYRHLRQPDN
jgi:hypothetical protein